MPDVDGTTSTFIRPPVGGCEVFYGKDLSSYARVGDLGLVRLCGIGVFWRSTSSAQVQLVRVNVEGRRAPEMHHGMLFKGLP